MGATFRQALADRNLPAIDAYLAQNPEWRPENEQELVEFGNQFTMLGVALPSETIARRYLAHDPESLAGQQLLLTALVQLSQYEAARPIAHEVLRRDPANLLALSSLGVVEQVSGAIEEAIELYKQALAIDPSYGTALRNLTFLLTAQGRGRERAIYDGGLINWRSSLFMERPRYQLSANPMVVEAAKMTLSQGFCVMRGVINPDFIARMRQAFFVEGGAEAMAASIGVETFLSAPLGQACQRLGIPFAVESVLAIPLWETLTEVFGQEPELDPGQTVLRLVGSDRETSHVPFHQDMRAFGKIGANVWAPMTPAGGDHPGLELIPKRFTKLLPTMATAGDYDYLNIDLAEAATELDVLDAVRPELSPGDCILFLGDVVHRSYIPSASIEQAASQRLSVEMRFFAQS